jgi:ribonuclease P protein component
MGEANLPAQEPQTHADARFPCPYGDAGGPRRHQEPPAEGPSQAHRLIWRVGDRASFARLGNERRVRQGPLSLAMVPGAPDGTPDMPPRVAYAIGKRVGPAVTRNRVRRRLRACVRHHAAALQPGAIYLFGASPAAADTPFAQLDDSVGRLLARVGRSA